MNDIKKRGIISIVLAVVIFFVGAFIASNDISVGLAFLAAIIGGGCFWMGSRP